MKKQKSIRSLLKWDLFTLLSLFTFGASAQSINTNYYVYQETKWETPNQDLSQLISLQRTNIIHILILQPNGQFRYYITSGTLKENDIVGPNNEVRNIYTGYWKKRRNKRINLQYLQLFPFYGEIYTPEEADKTASYFLMNNHLRIKDQATLLFEGKPFIQHTQLSSLSMKSLNLPLKPLMEEMEAQREELLPLFP